MGKRHHYDCGVCGKRQTRHVCDDCQPERDWKRAAIAIRKTGTSPLSCVRRLAERYPFSPPSCVEVLTVLASEGLVDPEDYPAILINRHDRAIHRAALPPDHHIATGC